MGNIYNSKFRSGHYITMSKRLKKCGYKNDYPGPGSYIRFSQFGILVPKNYRRGYSAYNTFPNRNKKEKYETPFRMIIIQASKINPNTSFFQ